MLKAEQTTTGEYMIKDDRATESYEQRQQRINQMGKRYSFADVCEAAGHLGAEYGQGFGHAGDDVPKDIISCNYLSWAQRIIDRLEANNADQG
jgi:hypothetical protein